MRRTPSMATAWRERTWFSAMGTRNLLRENDGRTSIAPLKMTTSRMTDKSTIRDQSTTPTYENDTFDTHLHPNPSRRHLDCPGTNIVHTQPTEHVRHARRW